jgi:ATP-dependent RNA circularization protein (DNA/RNA ligase family)
MKYGQLFEAASGVWMQRVIRLRKFVMEADESEEDRMHRAIRLHDIMLSRVINALTIYHEKTKKSKK